MNTPSAFVVHMALDLSKTDGHNVALTHGARHMLLCVARTYAEQRTGVQDSIRGSTTMPVETFTSFVMYPTMRPVIVSTLISTSCVVLVA